mgnify:CR=1 FL=1
MHHDCVLFQYLDEISKYIAKKYNSKKENSSKHKKITQKMKNLRSEDDYPSEIELIKSL